MIQPTDASTDLSNLSGLEAMTAVLTGDLPRPPIAETMGFQLASVEEGRVTFTGTPSKAFTNPMGTLHGGWYGALLDSAMGCAVMTKLAVGTTYTTLEYKVNLIRGIPLGTDVVCIGWTNHAGRSTSVATAEIRDAETDRLYATATSTCIVMKQG